MGTGHLRKEYSQFKSQLTKSSVAGVRVGDLARPPVMSLAAIFFSATSSCYSVGAFTWASTYKLAHLHTCISSVRSCSAPESRMQ